MAPTGSIKSIRKEIDSIDSQIIELLKKRADLSIKIGELKKEQNIKIEQPERERELLKRVITIAKKEGLSEDYVKSIFEIIIEESKKKQSRIAK